MVVKNNFRLIQCRIAISDSVLEAYGPICERPARAIKFDLSNKVWCLKEMLRLCDTRNMPSVSICRLVDRPSVTQLIIIAFSPGLVERL